MKKILTLLLSVGLFCGSFAQGKHYHKKDYDRSDQYASVSNGRYSLPAYDRNRNGSYENRRAAELQRINEEYNYKVHSIESNRYIKRRQKKLAIRDAQKERQRQIQLLNRRFDRRSDHHRNYYKGRE